MAPITVSSAANHCSAHRPNLIADAVGQPFMMNSKMLKSRRRKIMDLAWFGRRLDVLNAIVTLDMCLRMAQKTRQG